MQLCVGVDERRLYTCVYMCVCALVSVVHIYDPLDGLQFVAVGIDSIWLSVAQTDHLNGFS